MSAIDIIRRVATHPIVIAAVTAALVELARVLRRRKLP